MPMPFHRYRPYPRVELPDRTWPDRRLERAPQWVSVDLRDGNQALVNPMDIERKRRMFELLVEVGFEEIEVGFPCASKADYDFVRVLVDEGLIPDDVTIVVLTQARQELIERTIEGLAGRAAVDRPPVQLDLRAAAARRVPLRPRRASRDLAVQGAIWCRDLAGAARTATSATSTRPRAFTGTEPDYALEVCEAVMDVLRADARPPADPEPAGDRRDVDAEPVRRHDRVVLPQRAAARERDHLACTRTTTAARAVAATELALMAGGERVEGSPVRQRRAHRQRRPRHAGAEPVHAGRRPGPRPVRHRPGPRDRRGVHRAADPPAPPVRRRAGLHRLLRVAPGRHQEGLRGDRAHRRRAVGGALPADRPARRRPHVRGRDPGQQPVRQGRRRLRAEDRPRLDLPRALQVEFSQVIQAITDAEGGELSRAQLCDGVRRRVPVRDGPLELVSYRVRPRATTTEPDGVLATVDGEQSTIQGDGQRPDRGVRGRAPTSSGSPVRCATTTSTRSAGARRRPPRPTSRWRSTARRRWGVGIHSNIVTASLRAVISAVNRAARQSPLRSSEPAGVA